MNFETLTPSAKMIKKQQSYATGQSVPSGDIAHIAIVNANDVIESKRLVENITHGIKSSGGSVFVHNVAYLGYTNKINPMTAKYAESFVNTCATTAEAIIRTNMIDGVVIVTDCDVTASGLLIGCIKANCPVIVLPLGSDINFDAMRVAGKITSGELTNKDSEDFIRKSVQPKGRSTFFACLEKVELCVATAAEPKPNMGTQLVLATETGKKAVAYAKDLKSPKKLLIKTAYQDIVDFCLKSGGDISALWQIKKLFIANDEKIKHEFIGERISKISPAPKVVFAKGSACTNGGYIQYSEATPPIFNGKAWVYASLEDADLALLSGSIPNNSVMIIHGCTSVNITALALAIEAMGRQNDIAIATDGLCDMSNVLAITMCTPDSYANEEFANIQNGDALEIDIARGRFNTSVLSKDIKIRAKKNITKKQPVYFV